MRNEKKLNRVLPNASGVKAGHNRKAGPRALPNFLGQFLGAVAVTLPTAANEPPELKVLIALANMLRANPSLSAETFFRDHFADRFPSEMGFLNEIPTRWPDGAEFSTSEMLYNYAKDAAAGLTMLATTRPDKPHHFPWHLVATWDLKRIRICEVCQKLFYATRTNRDTCSKRHAATLRKRRIREKKRRIREKQPDCEYNRKLKGIK
jgi:hypothetical protein